MAEFFGDLERLAADLYPWRYPIGAAILIAIAAVAFYGYRRGWHTWAWERRLPVALVGVPALALVGFVAYDLGSPLFINVTVEDEFPFAYTAEVPAGMTMTDVEQTMATLSKMDQPTMNEAMPDMAAMPAPAKPTKLKEGDFRDADSFHKGSGQALIYSAPDGAALLRLENFKVTNGPELHVLLSMHPDPDRRADLLDAGYLDLGRLKGNIGNQNYDIPEGVDLGAQQSVVIYCMPFHVVFSVATLQDAN